MSDRALVRRRLRVLVPSFLPGLTRPAQLAASLVLMVIGVLFTAELLGVGTDPRESLRQSRTSAAESLAVQLSVFAGMGADAAIERSVQRFVEGNADVRVTELRRTNGAVLARYGEAELLGTPGSTSTLTHLVLPILHGQEPWGELRVVFVAGGVAARRLGWFVFVGGMAFISFALFLSRALIQLDPSRVVPSRVENAFDLFSAGVVILDDRLRIVMANRSVSRTVGRASSALTGQSMDEWAWQEADEWQSPWATCFHSGLAVSDQLLRLKRPDGQDGVYSVSCAAVGANNDKRGVLVTLDDLTPLEQRNRVLSETLEELERSQEAINLKNRELELLATTDPLTGVANRRTLMERLAQQLERARAEGTPLACIMSDIDHFKSVNDTYGHGVGDEVIRAVAQTLQQACREEDTIGRYGGEEFVLVLPGLDAAAAAEMADRVRVGVIALALGDRLAVPQLSSSFGVADVDCGAEDAAALVDAADKALYVAKQGGRNRVEIHRPEALLPDGEWAAAADPGVAPGTAPSAIAPSIALAGTAAQPRPVHPSSEDLTQARVVELEARLRESERALADLSEYDTLTGAPLRVLFLQRLESELSRSGRSGTLVGVMAFEMRDLDRIVSSYGHAASDALMVEFVARLQAGLRTTDVVSELTTEHNLSRITSNEYGVLLVDLSDSVGAMIVVTRLKRLLSQPFLVAQERVYIGANIGIALSGSPGCTGALLFQQASEARKAAAKKSDKVSHGFASAVLDEESHDYIRLEADLHDALENRALEVWYQPKFDLVERRIKGLEALLRWRHETRGYISPAIFVAVAEANGLIDRLSTLVLQTTLSQIALWESMGLDDLRVSVNVSPMQLHAESLVGDTLQALSRAGVSGSKLEIELTETSVLERPESARVALDRLRSAGITISMDDFGTGYTSLALLADLPLDTVKIDRSFILQMRQSEQSRAVVSSIISMAHALQLRVVGEGVETNEELELLSNYGCDEVQGYLISRPQPAEDITAFLVQQRASEAARRRA